MATHTELDSEILRQYRELAKILPAECHTRLGRGLLLALDGAVTLDNTRARVNSATKPEVQYIVTTYGCDCKDSRAPIYESTKLCKHYLAYRMVSYAGNVAATAHPPDSPANEPQTTLDLDEISCRHGALTGITVVISRRDRHHRYNHVTDTSSARLARTVYKLSRSPHLTLVPLLYTGPGWSLETGYNRDPWLNSLVDAVAAWVKASKNLGQPPGGPDELWDKFMQTEFDLEQAWQEPSLLEPTGA